MKCIANGRTMDKYEELSAYEYEYFGIAWTPVENGRMAYVLVGTNDKDAGNWSPLFDADRVNYTGQLHDKVFGGTTYVFKNGYLHNDNGLACFDKNGKGSVAKNGLFEGPSGEQNALQMLKHVMSEAVE